MAWWPGALGCWCWLHAWGARQVLGLDARAYLHRSGTPGAGLVAHDLAHLHRSGTPGAGVGCTGTPPPLGRARRWGARLVTWCHLLPGAGVGVGCTGTPPPLGHARCWPGDLVARRWGWVHSPGAGLVAHGLPGAGVVAARQALALDARAPRPRARLVLTWCPRSARPWCCGRSPGSGIGCTGTMPTPPPLVARQVLAWLPTIWHTFTARACQALAWWPGVLGCWWHVRRWPGCPRSGTPPPLGRVRRSPGFPRSARLWCWVRSPGAGVGCTGTTPTPSQLGHARCWPGCLVAWLPGCPRSARLRWNARRWPGFPVLVLLKHLGRSPFNSGAVICPALAWWPGAGAGTPGAGFARQVVAWWPRSARLWCWCMPGALVARRWPGVLVTWWPAICPALVTWWQGPCTTGTPSPLGRVRRWGARQVLAWWPGGPALVLWPLARCWRWMHGHHAHTSTAGGTPGAGVLVAVICPALVLWPLAGCWPCGSDLPGACAGLVAHDLARLHRSGTSGAGLVAWGKAHAPLAHLHRSGTSGAGLVTR